MFKTQVRSNKSDLGLPHFNGQYIEQTRKKPWPVLPRNGWEEKMHAFLWAKPLFNSASALLNFFNKLSLRYYLSIAYYILTWSYQDLLYFAPLCQCLIMCQLTIWSIIHFYFHFHFNESYNFIKTVLLVYLDIFSKVQPQGVA